uniref:Uncharacterized protein n=1 Tax=Rhabditophanes sp. KR3021 TaxID=114890 RepID=A0AC35TH77_9BILA
MSERKESSQNTRSSRIKKPRIGVIVISDDESKKVLSLLENVREKVSSGQYTMLIRMKMRLKSYTTAWKITWNPMKIVLPNVNDQLDLKQLSKKRYRLGVIFML